MWASSATVRGSHQHPLVLPPPTSPLTCLQLSPSGILTTAPCFCFSTKPNLQQNQLACDSESSGGNAQSSPRLTRAVNHHSASVNQTATPLSTGCCRLPGAPRFPTQMLPDSPRLLHCMPNKTDLPQRRWPCRNRPAGLTTSLELVLMQDSDLGSKELQGSPANVETTPRHAGALLAGRGKHSWNRSLNTPQSSSCRLQSHPRTRLGACAGCSLQCLHPT